MIYSASPQRGYPLSDEERFRVIRRLAVGLLLLPLIAAVGCGGDLPKGAVAQVGTALVSQDRFDNVKAMYEAAGRAPDKESQEDEYRKFEQGVAEYLVMMEVVGQKASSFGITVTEEDVQEQIDQIKQMFQGDEDKFEEALDSQNISLEQLTQSTRDNLLLEAVKEAVTTGLTVTEEEAKAYYEAHQTDYVQQEERETRHILISPYRPVGEDSGTSEATQADWDAAKVEAEKVRSEIQNGADFVTEAQKYSDDETTSESGGDLGPITRGQMTLAFEEAVFSLKKGELSEPVRTQYGYHVIQVTDILPEKQLSFDRVRENIKSILLDRKRSEAWQNWLADQKEKLGVIYREGLEPETTETSPIGEPSTNSAEE